MRLDRPASVVSSCAMIRSCGRHRSASDTGGLRAHGGRGRRRVRASVGRRRALARSSERLVRKQHPY
jgi:hypothetical protein